MHNPLIKLAFNKSTGKVEFIDVVKNGLKCNCYCPKCGEDLVARQGDENQHTFAHVSNSMCLGNDESVAHILAKQIIEEEKYFYIDSDTKIEFDNVIAEENGDTYYNGSSYKADLIAFKGDKKLYIEIKFSHDNEKEKKEFIVNKKFTTFQIEINQIEKFETFKEGVFKFFKRYWIYNKKLGIENDDDGNPVIKKIVIEKKQKKVDKISDYEKKSHIESDKKVNSLKNKLKDKNLFNIPIRGKIIKIDDLTHLELPFKSPATRPAICFESNELLSEFDNLALVEDDFYSELKNYVDDEVMFKIINTGYQGNGRVIDFPVAIPLKNLEDDDSNDHFQELLELYNAKK